MIFAHKQKTVANTGSELYDFETAEEAHSYAKDHSGVWVSRSVSGYRYSIVGR